MHVEMSARQPQMALRDCIDRMLSKGGVLSEVEFSPLVMASAQHHARDIKSMSTDFFTEVRQRPWFKQVTKLYVGISDAPSTRWRDELKKEFKGLQIVRTTVLVAGGHDPSFGVTTGATLEGIIAQAASVILPDMAIVIVNSVNKYGAGTDKQGDTVHLIKSWAEGGKAEFESFAEHTEKGLCSRKRGTGTKALFNKILWQDAGAKHAYVVFLSPRDPGDKISRADVTHDSLEDVDDDEGSDWEWEMQFPPITQGGGAGGVAAGGSSRVPKRLREGGGE